MIKAIDTIYNGYKFRSRLEARWAVFFDALHIKWEYEAEGYILSDGTHYLPDFWLPTFSGGLHVEVKPDGGDFSKAIQFAADTKFPIWLAEGTPGCRSYDIYAYEDEADEKSFNSYVGIPNADGAYKENRMFVYPGYENSDNSIDEENWDCLGEWYLDAVRSARSARFEFNQTAFDNKNAPQAVQ